MSGAARRGRWWASRSGALASLGVLLLALAAWSALMAGSELPTNFRAELADVTRSLSSGLFLTAGVLRMASWRLTRDWNTARSAITLLVIGTALPGTSVLGLVVHDGPVVDLEGPETRLVFLLPILVLAIAGARHSRHLMRLTLGVLAAVTLCVAAAVVFVAGSAPVGEHHAALWLIVESLTAAVWAALAAQAWWRRHFVGQVTPGWVTVALLIMAVGDGLKAWSLADADAVHSLSGGFQLAAGLLALAAASAGLWAAVRTETGHNGAITRVLIDTQQRLADVEQLQRERLHDARSAVIGVIGASELLARPPSTSASFDPATLRSLVSHELTRLQGLLATDGAEPLVEFDLAEALALTVVGRRMDGMVIDTDWRGARVVGRRQATATVLDNLLRNAHVHAPRARVLVAARTVGDEVEIIVKDDGPGIPAAERGLVLYAGMRGSTARGSGSGLGLYNAASTMAAQSGSLRIDRSSGGGTKIVLGLPSAVHTPAMAS